MNSLVSADFFRAIESAFLEAQKRETVYKSSYHLAGQPIQMQIAGSVLASHTLPPFSHLKAELDNPSLRVLLWDAKATGVPCPLGLPPETRTDEWGSATQAFAYGFERRYVEYRSHVGTTWLDRASNCLYGCYNDASQFTIYDYSRPLPWLLPVWCNDLGVQVVHTGMVSWKGSGVLLAGPSGSGKTTAVLACLSGGFDYLAEDQTGLGEQNGEFEGFSFYNSARVDANHLKRFPHLASHAQRENDQKTLLMLSELFPGQFVGEAPVRIMLLPRVTPRENSTLERATPAEALRTVAANSLMLPIGGGRRGFERLARLVRHVPCYWLSMGSDLGSIPSAVRGALSS
ncbi:hypothetical protein IAD21_06372 [Abditibacteriota bacterium]|nr:hypothetical protein IAD21_06372 [Abditibacteriota bacterium]